MTGTNERLAGETIEQNLNTIAEAVTAKHFALKPELEARYGAAGRAKCLQDNAFHLSYLSEALRAAQPSLFANYIAWAKIMLAGRGISDQDLADNLSVLSQSLSEKLSPEESRVACRYVDAGKREIGGDAAVTESFLTEREPLAELADAYLSSLLGGRRDRASKLILDAVEAKTAGVREIYLHVFQKAQHEIGRLWQTNRISIAQEHYCTAATQMIMSQLYPYIFTSERKYRTLVATCVSGDLHEIGVRMVSDFFEMDGWDTFYLGANTPAVSVIQTVKERKADLLLVSATMTYHLRDVREVIARMRADEETKNVKIMVGGYPFNLTPNLWREVGADAFASDALTAVKRANELLEEND